MRIRFALIGLLAFAWVGCGGAPTPEPAATPTAAGDLSRTFPAEPGEAHLSELHMLTDGGENAEAYFSFDGTKLVFQSTREPYGCDQIFTMNTDGSELQLVSTGLGRTTCAYFLPGDQEIIYASTHLGDENCPPPPDMSQGYVWAVYPSYDLFRVGADGTGLAQLTTAPGYDAEATVSPQGDRIVFTSTRDGDLDLYAMDLDGSNLVRLTDQPGYDGGAFYSPDGTQIVYRAHHPTDPEAIEDYTSLLEQGLIRPGQLEVWVMDADGSNKRQVTNLGAAAFAPFFHPSGERIVFSSNYGDPTGREFELFMIDLDGANLEQVTHSEGFDGFPMWSPDGNRFVFCSNRHNSKPGETNVFIATWVE